MSVKVLKANNENRQYKIKTIFPSSIVSHHKGILIALPEYGATEIKIYNLGCTDSEYKRAAEAMLSQIKASGEVSLSK